MSIINVKCVDQTLMITNTPKIASGGVKEDSIVFDFDSAWNEYVKTAVFWVDPQHVYNVLIDSNNTAIIPAEVLTHEGKIYFGVFGVLNDVTRTSEILTYDIVQGALTSGSTPPEPTPDIYAQILASYGEMLDDFNNLPYVHYVDGDAIDPDTPIIDDENISGSTTYSSEKIEDKFSNENITITELPTGVTGEVRFNKAGNVVVCNFEVRFADNLTGATAKIILPEGFIPTDENKYIGIEEIFEILHGNSVSMLTVIIQKDSDVLDTPYTLFIKNKDTTGRSVHIIGSITYIL